MKYNIARNIQVLWLAGLITASVPSSMYSMGWEYSTYAKGVASLLLLGSAGYGGYHYGHEVGAKDNQKKASAAVRAEDAKTTTALIVMELGLQNIVNTRDLEVYARGTYGYTVQPMTTLQKHMNDMGKRLVDIGLLLTSDQHREQHKKVSELLNQVRTRIGELNPAVFAHEVQVAQALETAKKLEESKIEHQRKLQEQARVQQAKIYQLVQEEQATKVEVNKLVAEANAKIIAQGVFVEAVARDHAAMAVVCTSLPATIEETGRQQALEVSSAIHDLKKETGKKLDELCSRIEQENTQMSETVAKKVCEVAQDQTKVLALHMNTTTTKLGDKMDNMEKKLAVKSNELGEKVAENTNQITKQGADVTSIKCEVGAIKRLVQERSDVKSAPASSAF